MKKAIEIISREHHTQQTVNLGSSANSSLQLTESSIVQMQASPADILSYERVGDDLIVHMKDGSSIDYSEFFLKDAAGKHSELVLSEAGKQSVHIAFDEAAMADAASQGGVVDLTASVEPVEEGIEALLYSDDDGGILGPLLGAGLAATLLGSVIAAGDSHDHGKDDRADDNDGGEGPSIAVHPITGDDFISHEDVTGGVTIEGTSSESTGCKVVVKVNGREFTTTTDEKGNWSVDVPTDVWNGIDGEIEVVAVVTNESGNTAETDRTVTVDTDADGLQVTVNPVTGDDAVNASEAAAGVTIDGSSSAPGAGCEVVVRIAGKEFKTLTDENGNWSVDVPSVVWNGIDGETDIVVVMTNESGDTAEAERTVTVDTDGPHIVVHPVTGDDLINATEAADGITIDGTSSASAGCEVVVKVNGREFTTTTDEKGNWSVDVPTDVWNGIDGEAEVVAIVTDEFGNTAEAGRKLAVDTEAPTVTIDPVAEDDIVNAAEHQQALTISGATTGLKGGETLTLELNGKSYTAEVGADGRWALTIDAADTKALADGDYTIKAVVKDAAGNEGHVEHQVLVDATAPGVTIDPVAGDDVIDAVEHQQALTISGATTGLKGGETLTLELNGKSYTAEVGADGRWALTIDAVDTQALADGDYTIKAVVKDAAGNEGHVEHQVVVEGEVVPTVTIDTVAEDDIINAAEHGQALEISGTSLGLDVGQELNIELNGKTYTAEVGAGGSWLLSIDVVDVQALTDGNYTITASVGGAVDLVSDTHDIVVDTSAPTITIDTVSGDNVIDAAEQQQALTISGTTTGLAEGDLVHVHLNGGTYSGKVSADGSWSLEVSADKVAGLANGTHTITAWVSDTAGNSASSTADIDVQGHSGLVTMGEDFQGWMSEEGTSADMSAGHSYTFKSGLTLTGIKNGTPGTELFGDSVYNVQGAGDEWPEEGGNLVGWIAEGAIGEVSFGHPVEKVSFSYMNVHYGFYVEVYDTDGNMIDRVKLDGVDSPDENPYGPSEFSYQAPDGVLIDHIRLDGTDEKYGVLFDNFTWSYHEDGVAVQQDAVIEEGTSGGVEALAAVAMDDNSVSGSEGNDHLTSTADNDHFSIGNGGGDLLTYHLLNAADATGGNGADRISGFTVGNGADADRIDLRELLADTGYRGSAEGQPDEEALAEFIKVTVKGNDTEIAIDRDGAGNSHEMTTLVTLSDVQTDLATLLANQQLIV